MNDNKQQQQFLRSSYDNSLSKSQNNIFQQYQLQQLQKNVQQQQSQQQLQTNNNILNQSSSQQNFQKSQQKSPKSSSNNTNNKFINSGNNSNKQSLNRSNSYYQYNNVQESYHLTVYGNPQVQDQSQQQSCKFSQHYGKGFIQCAAGEDFSMFINENLELFGCGNNQYGQLGIDGIEHLDEPQLIPGLKDHKIGRVFCGSDHTFALTNTGEVFAWGLNLKGQLGLGHYENVSSPQLVHSLLPFGTSNTKAKKAQENYQQMHRKMKSMSDLKSKQLGALSEEDLKDGVGSIENIMEQLAQQMSSQENNTNSVDQEAQLNLLLLPDERVTSIACGSLHTLILTNKNRLFSTGYGETFALGTGKSDSVNEFIQIELDQSQQQQNQKREKIEKIACGLSHSACLMQNKVYIWGIAGQNQQLIFKDPVQIDFGTQNTITDIKLGDCLSIFMNYKGEVYALGSNIEGQLGQEDEDVSFLAPQKVKGLPKIDQISLGRNYCLAISSDFQNIYGWGSNSCGQVTGKKGLQNIFYPQQVYIGNCEPYKVYCGSFHNILLTNYSMQDNQDNFLMQNEQEQEFDSMKQQQQKQQEDLAMQEIIQDQNNDLKKYQNEIQKLQQKNEALQQLSTKILQKNEKLTNELQSMKYKLQENNNSNDSGKQQKGNHKKNASKFEIQGVDGGNTEIMMQHRQFTNQLEIDFNQIQQGTLISEGGYGKIFKGKWRECTVAIKMFKIDANNENSLKDFLSECHAMEALRHPNIVMFLGACTKKPNFSIILEFCKNGSLWGILQNPSYHLSWERRRHIALDGAKGVHYLHKCTPPILHRDLKSLNLLLDEAMRCKLADFGWTKSLSNYMTGKIGTYQWMAPEVIAGQPYTEKADVYSFGIILWEIASRQPPYRDKTGIQVSYEVLNNNLRPPIPKDTPPDFAALIRVCWDKNPDMRPNFYQIVKELENMRLPSSNK